MNPKALNPIPKPLNPTLNTTPKPKAINMRDKSRLLLTNDKPCFLAGTGWSGLCCRVLPLGLQIAQSRPYLWTLDPTLGTSCILRALTARILESVNRHELS